MARPDPNPRPDCLIPPEVRDQYEPGWRACATTGHHCAPPGCGCSCHWTAEELA